MLFGCEVDESRPPGLQNEIPNSRGAGNGAGAVGASSSGGSTGTLNPPDAAPATTPCDIAAALAITGSNACVQCEKVAVTSASQCQTAFTDCQADTPCANAIPCVAACTPSGTCVQDCVAGSPVFASLLGCLLTNCGAFCGPPSGLPCDVADAGDAGDGG